VFHKENYYVISNNGFGKKCSVFFPVQNKEKKSEWRDYMGIEFENSGIPSTLKQDQAEDEINSCAEAEYVYGILIISNISKKKINTSIIIPKNGFDRDNVIELYFELKGKYLFIILLFNNGTEMKFCLDVFKPQNLKWILILSQFKNLAIENSDGKILFLSDISAKEIITEVIHKFRSIFKSKELLFAYLLSLYVEQYKDMPPEAFLNKFHTELSEILKEGLEKEK
jgi:hypothetical protein